MLNMARTYDTGCNPLVQSPDRLCFNYYKYYDTYSLPLMHKHTKSSYSEWLMLTQYDILKNQYFPPEN